MRNAGVPSLLPPVFPFRLTRFFFTSTSDRDHSRPDGDASTTRRAQTVRYSTRRYVVAQSYILAASIVHDVFHASAHSSLLRRNDRR
ncbi:hypothetical protein KCP77_24490 [Salmonella enterica subsp. enterica]|nr:hypothetical protein KCP77_24490 [Salmonella enterica subsp. enterica]